MKKSFPNILFLIVMLCVLIGILKYPKLALNSATDGLYTWFNIVIPSLLPFFIVSEILVGIGFVNFISKFLQPLMKPIFNVSGAGAFSLSMSLVSGYPIGAKIVSHLRQNNTISKIEADRMVCFSSTSGPLFILGAVSIGMLNNPQLESLIIYPHYLGAITIGLILRFYKGQNNYKFGQSTILNPMASKPDINLSIGSLLANSVKKSMNTIALIGGFIIFYSVLTELLFLSKFFNLSINTINKIIPINIEVLKGFVAGMLELTTGCKKISAININIIYKIAIINFLIGWSGFSIHSQALSFICNTDINVKLYLFAKFLHGIFSSFYSLILYIIKYKTIIQPSFLPNTYTIKSMYLLEWPILFISSIKLAILVTIYMLISSLIMLLISSFSSLK
ncbi:MAG: sporulation integral membrane protein YlbJ [Tissierellia bacterium]|nr:sporulation integral membrane protein YlbJ [Tissierellia bacterium]